MRIILSKPASNRKSKLMYADVSRAYFYAPAGMPVYVQIAAEDMNPGEEGLVGRLKMSMHGTRDVAANWAAEYGATLVAAGYVQGIASPCVFHHSEHDATIMEHGNEEEEAGKYDQTAVGVFYHAWFAQGKVRHVYMIHAQNPMAQEAVSAILGGSVTPLIAREVYYALRARRSELQLLENRIRRFRDKITGTRWRS